MIRPWRLECKLPLGTGWMIWGTFSTERRAWERLEAELDRTVERGRAWRVKARDGWQA